jgi:hypothetical protein
MAQSVDILSLYRPILAFVSTPRKLRSMSEHDTLPTQSESPPDAPVPIHQTSWYKTAKRISRQLNERGSAPFTQIKRVVQVCGEETALAWAAEALKIEANGGMMVENGSRRRSVGGIFFYLVKTRVRNTPAFAQIFPQQVDAEAVKAKWKDLQARRKAAKAEARAKREAEAAANPPPPKPEKPKREPPPPPPLTQPVTREVIIAALPALLDQSGELRSMRVHVTGRPDAVEQRDQTVMFALQLTKFPPMPKGVPEPPPLPQTYLVYVGLKQWNRVAEAIANPDDFLILEGICAFDPELGQQVIYTNSITTKLLEDAKRAPKKPQEETNKPAEAAAQAELPPPPPQTDPIANLRAKEAKLQARIEQVKALPFSQRKELPSLMAQLQEVQAQIAAAQP